MNRKVRNVIAILVLIVLVYCVWAYTERQSSFDRSYAGSVDMQQFGSDSGRGNIVSIQPYMYPGDYASEKTFYDALNYYMQMAAKKGYLHTNSVVSFPEYLGTWLVVAGEKKGVFDAKTAHDAMELMAMSNLVKFLPKYFTSKAKDKSADALFRMKANRMARIYHHTFSSLANQYGVTIVAGSIVLPGAEVKQGKLTVNSKEQLFNVSLVYKPDGHAEEKIVRKAFPIADELVFTCNENPSNIPLYNTPAGKMAVLICADSWYADCYKQSVKEQAKFVIVPSYVEGDNAFKNPWPGYSGFANPTDIDKNDIGKITILDGWLRYALPGRMKQAGLQNGIITYLHGRFWNLGSDARFVLVNHGETVVKQPNADAGIVCLWL